MRLSGHNYFTRQFRGFPGLAPEVIAGVPVERLRAAAVYFTLNAANVIDLLQFLNVIYQYK